MCVDMCDVERSKMMRGGGIICFAVCFFGKVKEKTRC